MGIIILYDGAMIQHPFIQWIGSKSKPIHFMVPQKRNLNLYKCCECGVEFERAQFSVKDLDKAHCGCKFDYMKDWKYGEILKSRWVGINRRTVNGLYKEAKFQISGRMPEMQYVVPAPKHGF